MESPSITHVYLMPGLAANSTIFEFIKLPEDRFELHRLDWLLPKQKESLRDYAQRMCRFVNHEDVVLLGVSFGGVVVQEMVQFLKVKRLIIVSSVKCRRELPKAMQYASRTGLFKILPTSLVGHLDTLGNLAIGDYAKKRVELYKKYLSVTDTRYLDWAIEHMVCWDTREPRQEVVHIHGDKDEIFPYKNIEGCIRVPGGTHVMIINRFKWFNEHLEEIINTGAFKGEKEVTSNT